MYKNFLTDISTIPEHKPRWASSVHLVCPLKQYLKAALLNYKFWSKLASHNPHTRTGMVWGLDKTLSHLMNFTVSHKENIKKVSRFKFYVNTGNSSTASYSRSPVAVVVQWIIRSLSKREVVSSIPGRYMPAMLI